MPVNSTDIVFRYSAPGATGGGITPGVAGGSLGRYCAINALPTASLNNLFPDVTGDENASSHVDYQCLFVHNTHPTLTLLNAFTWVAADVAGGTTVSIGVDPSPVSLATAITAQALAIADKDSAPFGVTFAAPTTKATGLPLGNIGPGQVKAIWVRRIAANTPAFNSDGITLAVGGDTVA